MANKKALGNNPLLSNTKEEKPVLSQKDIEIIRAAQERTEEDDSVTMSFKIGKKVLKTLRDYAYTERLDQRTVLERALNEFFSNIDTSQLLECPERIRRPRKRRDQ